jgi:hypothetical protein
MPHRLLGDPDLAAMGAMSRALCNTFGRRARPIRSPDTNVTNISDAMTALIGAFGTRTKVIQYPESIAIRTLTHSQSIAWSPPMIFVTPVVTSLLPRSDARNHEYIRLGGVAFAFH